MSITGIVEYHGVIFASSSKGELIQWDLRHFCDMSFNLKIKSCVSLLKNTDRIQLQKSNLQGLYQLGKTLITHSRTSIYILDADSLIGELGKKNKKNLSVSYVKCESFMNTRQEITCVKIMGNFSLLIGTNQGRIYLHDLAQNKSRLFFQLSEDNRQVQAVVYSTLSRSLCGIVSLQLYRQDSLCLLSTTNNKVIKLSLVTGTMIEQMDVLERVNSIFIDTNKFYCLHDNYISEWSFELGACIAVIRICNPKCMVKVDNSLLVAGPYQDVIEIKDGEYKARETSMKSVTSLCQFGTLIVEGGADNLIDIRTPAMRIVTLYSQA